MMYVLERTKTGFKIVAQVHPSNVPEDHKKEMYVANAGTGTFAVYEDKSWQNLPLTKRYEHPWAMEIVSHAA